MEIKITFFDGVDCIGGNKFLLESKSSSIFLDFGQNFNEEGKYFDEFLKPRKILGIKDLLILGLLPPLRGIYRKDFEIPKIWNNFRNHSLYREVEVQGVLLSHAHLDHMGYITYLDPDIPIITSLGSAIICKALQDTGSDLEASYIIPREVEDEILKAKSPKEAPYIQRKFFIIGEEKGCVNNFWKTCHSSRDLEHKELKFFSEINLEDFKIKAFPVDHSIPYALAFAIETPVGYIVYTGDLRLHGRNSYLTKKFIEEVTKVKPVVLICEGTHPNSNKNTSEEEVFENSLKVVKGSEGLVIVDFGARNIERLISFLEIAKETQRKLVLTLKDIYLLWALNEADDLFPNLFKEDVITLYQRPKGRYEKWEKAILEVFSFPEKMVGYKDIQKNPKDFILCFSYYDFPALLDINPQGGTYIYSSSEAYNEEMLIDHEKIENWMRLFGIKIFGSLGKDRESSGFHASGHLTGKDLEEMIETIKPEYLIPIHTQEKEFFKKFHGLCKVIFPNKGNTFYL
ncbi:MAG: exonuclease [Dictyoglomaceae bacterium]